MSAAALAVSLFALLAFAPLASATPDPVASGTTTVTLNKGWTNYLKTFGIKIQKVSPAKFGGTKATFKVTGGSMDPTNGLGNLTLGGGLKFKAGKKSATVKGLVLDTGKSALTGKVSGKKVKLASLSGLGFTRNGFGVNVSLKKLKLNSAGAKQLNKKLGFAKGKPKPFLAGKLIGKSASEAQPATVAIIPGGNASFGANAELLKKLSDVEVKLETISPTVAKSTLFEFPISGGSIAPTATAGVVNTIGGVRLTQKLPTGPTTALETEIALSNFYVDLSAHTVGVEVIAKSTASEKLNLGALPRTSIADLTLSGATVSTDVTNRKVTVQGASSVLQPVAAEVLNGFVQVYEGWLIGVLKAEGKSEAEAKAIAAKKVEGDHITAGNPLGNFSFTVQTQ